MRTINAMLVVVISLSGCASIETPPQHWPTPATALSNGCPDLSGAYNNHGSGIDEKHSGGALTSHIFPQAAKNWTKSDVEARERFSKASHIVFSGPIKDGLVLEAWMDNELLERVELQQNIDGGYRCEGGALLLSLPVFASAGGGMFFDTFRETAIIPTTDGSILVKYRGTGVGLGFYLIPLAMKFESWALYPSKSADESLK